MWVAIADWLLVDGEIDPPQSDTILSGVGVRLVEATLEASPEADSLREMPPLGTWPHYAVTGRIDSFVDVDVDESVRAEIGPLWETILDSSGVSYQVQCRSRFTRVPSRRVTVVGRAALVAPYEWHSFDLPDTRRDWMIEGVRHLGDHLAANLRPM